MGLRDKGSSTYFGKVLLVAVFLLSLVSFPVLMAQNVNAAEKCGKTSTFFNWGCDNSNPDGEQITPLLITILNWLALGVTIAVIGGIIYGAVMYMTSGGNQEQAKKAIGIIRNAVIALIMYFAMWALLNWLVPGGLFSS